jgi:hypothetical protein
MCDRKDPIKINHVGLTAAVTRVLAGPFSQISCITTNKDTNTSKGLFAACNIIPKQSKAQLVLNGGLMAASSVCVYIYIYIHMLQTVLPKPTVSVDQSVGNFICFSHSTSIQANGVLKTGLCADICCLLCRQKAWRTYCTMNLERRSSSLMLVGG